MPHDVNAFERLIDRALFLKVAGDSGGVVADEPNAESSRCWILLQALLVQSEQARQYAQRLLLRRAAERPEALRKASACERLQALLDLWPPGERDALADALHCSLGNGTMGALGGSLLASSSSAGPKATGKQQQCSTSDALRSPRSLLRPAWSDSPRLPAPGRQLLQPPQQQSVNKPTRSDATAVTGIGIGDSCATVRFGSSHAHAQQHSGGLGAAAGAVSESASTMPPPLAQRSGSLEASLDAWLRSSGSHAPSSLQQSGHHATVAEDQRSRSQPPPSSSNAIYKDRSLALDFGPSDTSSADDRGGRGPPRGLIGTPGFGRSTRTAEHDYYPGGAAAPPTSTWSRGGARRKGWSVGCSRSASGQDTCLQGSVQRANRCRSPEPGSIDEVVVKRRTSPHDSLAPATSGAEWWRCMALNVQRLCASATLRQLRSAVACWNAGERKVSQWQGFATRLRVQQASVSISSLKSVAVVVHSRRSLRLRLGHLATSVQLQWKLNLLLGLKEAAHSVQEAALRSRRVQRLAVCWRRCGLRQGLISWRDRHRRLGHTSDADRLSSQRLQAFCLQAWKSRRVLQVALLSGALRQAAQLRRSRQASAIHLARQVASAFCRARLRKAAEVWRSLEAAAADHRRRCASQQLAVRTLFLSLGRAIHLRTAQGLRRWHAAASRRAVSAGEAALGRAQVAVAQTILRSSFCSWRALTVNTALHRADGLRRFARALERSCGSRRRHAVNILYRNALNRGCVRHMDTVYGARLAVMRSEQEIGLEAMRLDLTGQLQRAAASKSASEDKSDKLQLRLAATLLQHRQMRLAGSSYQLWSLTARRNHALRRVASRLHAAQLTDSFHRFRRCVDGKLLAHLDMQVQCFNEFASRKARLTTSVAMRFADDRAALEEDVLQVQSRAALRSWRLVALESKAAAAKQRAVAVDRQRACRLLVLAVARLKHEHLHRQGWAPWRQVVTEARFAAGLTTQAEEVELLTHQLEEARAELRTMRLQAEAQCLTLSREVESEEARRVAAAAEVQAVCAAHVLWVWRSSATRYQRLSLRGLAAALRQAADVPAARRCESARWRSWGTKLCSGAVHKLTLALSAAAVRRTSRAAAQRGDSTTRHAAQEVSRARLQCARSQLRRLAASSQKVNQHRVLSGLRHVASRLASARQRWRRVFHCCRAAALRRAMSKLRRSSSASGVLSLQLASGEAIARHRRALAITTCASVLRRKWHLQCGSCLARLRANAVGQRTRESVASATSVALREALPMPGQLFYHILKRHLHQQWAASVRRWSDAARAMQEAEEREVERLQGLSCRSRIAASEDFRKARFRSARQLVQAWRCVAAGPKKMLRLLELLPRRRQEWSLELLRSHALSSRHVRFRSACLRSALARRRRRWLTMVMHAWRKMYCVLLRAQGQRELHLQHHRYRRLLRLAFCGLVQERCRMVSARRLGSMLHRADGLHALGIWRHQARLQSAALASVDLRSLQRQLTQQRADCQRFVEQRLREGAERTARALLHAWRCSFAVEKAALEQADSRRARAATSLFLMLATVRKRRCYAAVERWQGALDRSDVRLEAMVASMECSKQLRLARYAQGASALSSFFERRQQLDILRALRGPWQSLRSEARLQSQSSASVLEHRELQAECAELRGWLAASEEQCGTLGKQLTEEAKRNDKALAEAKLIASAVKKERRHHEAALDALQADLDRSLEDQDARSERAKAAERDLAQELGQLERRLREELARGVRLEADKKQAERDLAEARKELREAAATVERRCLEEMQQERAFHEQAMQLQQTAHRTAQRAQSLERESEVRAKATEGQAWASEQRSEVRARLHEREVEARAKSLEREAAERAKLAEREAAERAKSVEREAELKAHQAELRFEERVRLAEQHCEQRMDKQEWALEQQAAIAYDQERAAKTMEKHIQAQAEQLNRQRQEHSRTLDEVRRSACHSHSKGDLLLEQVSSLRRQLQREKGELQASERAWAIDRAALLDAVANATAGPKVSTKRPVRERSPTTRRQATEAAPPPQRRQGDGCSTCPWHYQHRK
eukprot:TRINITY_DN7193_c0_g1_i1.p1 TRINITY_DN7193_c0_g1~~TRINITY_DN7193_c0_g1_i1.p1  ORF type:complete len:2043 (+),score=408.52 TRINITY_DN7193_c0_g1_i1:113-6241(+)